MRAYIERDPDAGTTSNGLVLSGETIIGVDIDMREDKMACSTTVVTVETLQ